MDGLRASWTFFHPLMQITEDPTYMVTSLENAYAQITKVRHLLCRVDNANALDKDEETTQYEVNTF